MPGFEDLFADRQIRGSRARQEDSARFVPLCSDPDGSNLLMVLADGMGGHRGGAEASRRAVEAVCDTFPKSRCGIGIAARLRKSLDAANAAISQHVASHAGYLGMGCTLVAAVVTDHAVHWISVGDSPLWHLCANGNRLNRLNADHSMRPVLTNLARLGRITAQEARESAAHMLRSAVTGEKLSLVDEDETPVQLAIGDRIVLASDGLETLQEPEILRLCSGRRTPEATVSDLLHAVEERARLLQDNATVMVYQHPAPGAVRRGFDQSTA